MVSEQYERLCEMLDSKHEAMVYFEGSKEEWGKLVEDTAFLECAVYNHDEFWANYKWCRCGECLACGGDGGG